MAIFWSTGASCKEWLQKLRRKYLSFEFTVYHTFKQSRAKTEKQHWHKCYKFTKTYWHLINMLPTVGGLTTDCWPSVSWLLANSWSVLWPQPVGILSDNSPLTVNPQTAKKWPTVSQQTTNSQLTDGKQVFSESCSSQLTHLVVSKDNRALKLTAYGLIIAHEYMTRAVCLLGLQDTPFIITRLPI